MWWPFLVDCGPSLRPVLVGEVAYRCLGLPIFILVLVSWLQGKGAWRLESAGYEPRKMVEHYIERQARKRAPWPKSLPSMSGQLQRA